MTPRDTLNRLTATFSQSAQPKSAPRTDAYTGARSATELHLAEILAEVSATPVEDFAPVGRTKPRRDPAEALRWFVLSDALAFVFGFVMAWLGSALVSLSLLERSFPALLDVSRVTEFAVISLGAMFWLGVKGHYSRRKPFWMCVQQVIMALGFAAIADGFFQFVMQQDVSRLWLLSAWAFTFISLSTFRAVVRRVQQSRGQWQVRTLLVGSGSMAEEARAALRSEVGLGYDIVMQVENLPLLLSQTDHSWEALCDRFNADFVVIALDGLALAQADKALAKLSRSGIPFSVSPPLRHLPVLGMTPQYFFNHDVMLLTPVNNLAQPLPRFLKRSLDVVGSSLAVLALAPVFLTLIYLVRRDGGKAFFGHERIGLNGKAFNCLKLRSMVANGDQVLKDHLTKDEKARREWMATQKLKNDPRVTKVGDIMRRWSLDELPQLINVLKGDMSLVGPRPVVHEETLRYEDEIHQYYRVRPGLTGLWQVSGRSDVTFERRVQMDSWYVRNWSLWHDIAIICKTFPVVLKKTGAY